MIKFLLGFVTLVVVLLATYMFTNKSNETPKKITITKVEKKDVSEKQIEVSKSKEVKTPKKVISVAKSPKIVSTESTHEMANEEEIGKGITLESIENANVSDDEKERMEIDMLYYHSKHIISLPSPTNDEERKIIEEGVKDGIL